MRHFERGSDSQGQRSGGVIQDDVESLKPDAGVRQAVRGFLWDARRVCARAAHLAAGAGHRRPRQRLSGQGCPPRLEARGGRGDRRGRGADIKAQRKQETESKDGGYLRRELTYGDYERRVQLPGDVREADIRAGFENGMLSIEIPKVPAPQPVKIPVVGKPEKQLVGANS